MRQKRKVGLVFAAVLIVLTGTTLAVASNIDVLRAFFKGDTSSVQALVDTEQRSVSGTDFTFTVESSVSDDESIYLIVRADALNAAAAEKLKSENFVNMDTFHFYPVSDLNAAPPEDLGVDEASGAYISGVPALSGGSWGIKELPAETETSRVWTAEVGLPMESGAVALRARLCYMEADQFVSVPLAPAESISLAIGASGQGSPTYWSRSGGPLTVERVVLSPFTCRVDAYGGSILDHAPRILFRMADGTLRTQSQMMTATGSGDGPNGSEQSYSYRFNEVLDLSQLAGLVVFDREYPLSGGPSSPVPHDPALDSFELPLMSPLAEGQGYTVSVRALCEGLGGVCTWDNAAQTATLVYRDVSISLTLGSRTALVNGAAVALPSAPGVEDGKLTADSGVFRDCWGIGLFAFQERETELRSFLCWIVIP